MLIGKTSYYILKVVLFFAFSKRNSFSIRDIAKRVGISEKVLEQVLLLLKNKGVLSSKRGPRGGYSLLVDLSEYTLLEVLYMSGRKLDVMPMDMGRKGKVIDEIIEDINLDVEVKIVEKFENIKIKDLLLSIREKVTENGLSYTI